MEKIDPIRPEQVGENLRNYINPKIIEGFNELIALNYRNGYASFTLKEIIQHIKPKLPHLDEEEIYKNIHVEEIYKNAGWKVAFERPAYDENFEPHFQFKKA